MWERKIYLTFRTSLFAGVFWWRIGLAFVFGAAAVFVGHNSVAFRGASLYGLVLGFDAGSFHAFPNRATTIVVLSSVNG